MAKIEQNISGDNIKVNCGKLTGSIYCDDDQIKYIAGEAAKMFLYANLLHTDLYTYARYMESELIKIGLELFNGGEDSCGLTTSGGSMSIINAVYAYATRARRNGVRKPELIIPTSAHAAFEKSCEMFNVKCIKIPLNRTDYKVSKYKTCRKKHIKKYNMYCWLFPKFPSLCY